LDSYISLVLTKTYRVIVDSSIVCVDKLTEGAAVTVLLAQDYLTDNEELIVANS
jgi:hypothetical protein